MADISLDLSQVPVGGDFARVLDREDYLAMINATDEATVVLRAHLILEEFLNIWASRVTGTNDLFDGTFVPFKTKLWVCRNLGLAEAYFVVLDKFNDLRNRYSHRRKFRVEQSALGAIRTKIDALPGPAELVPCDKFEVYAEGHDLQTQQKVQFSYTWNSSDAEKRVLILTIAFVLKLLTWMQGEFNRRGIKYTLIASLSGSNTADNAR